MPDTNYVSNRDEVWGEYLMHYRTKGSKNGVRRYQNPDGSYTALGAQDGGRYNQYKATRAYNTLAKGEQKVQKARQKSEQASYKLASTQAKMKAYTAKQNAYLAADKKAKAQKYAEKIQNLSAKEMKQQQKVAKAEAKLSNQQAKNEITKAKNEIDQAKAEAQQALANKSAMDDETLRMTKAMNNAQIAEAYANARKAVSDAAAQRKYNKEYLKEQTSAMREQFAAQTEQNKMTLQAQKNQLAREEHDLAEMNKSNAQKFFDKVVDQGGSELIKVAAPTLVTTGFSALAQKMSGQKVDWGTAALTGLMGSGNNALSSQAQGILKNMANAAGQAAANTANPNQQNNNQQQKQQNNNQQQTQQTNNQQQQQTQQTNNQQQQQNQQKQTNTQQQKQTNTQQQNQQKQTNTQQQNQQAQSSNKEANKETYNKVLQDLRAGGATLSQWASYEKQKGYSSSNPSSVASGYAEKYMDEHPGTTMSKAELIQNYYDERIL